MFRSVTLILLLILGGAFSAQAQLMGGLNGSNDQPIEITADQLEVVQPNRVAVFKGNVEAIQGRVKLRASQMTVYYRDAGQRTSNLGAVSKIVVVGNVQLATPDETAQGARGVYLVDQKQIQLIGNVVLTRGPNILKGDRLDYDLRTQKSLLSSNPSGSTPGTPSSGGRVKGVFVPNQR